MADVLPEFETTDVVGTTDSYVGSVGTTPVLVPSTAGTAIEEVGIRCAVDQPTSTRLEYSFDGTNYFKLKVGEARETELRGGITQIYIRAAGSGITSANYEIEMNRGQL